jgi:hypothetical protein
VRSAGRLALPGQGPALIREPGDGPDRRRGAAWGRRPGCRGNDPATTSRPTESAAPYPQAGLGRIHGNCPELEQGFRGPTTPKSIDPRLLPSITRHKPANERTDYLGSSVSIVPLKPRWGRGHVQYPVRPVVPSHGFLSTVRSSLSGLGSSARFDVFSPFRMIRTGPLINEGPPSPVVPGGFEFGG